MHSAAASTPAFHSSLRAVRRGLAAASPLVAATLLTAAVFFLPAPGAGHSAQASTGQFELFHGPAAR
jgi:hypothetical protein